MFIDNLGRSLDGDKDSIDFTDSHTEESPEATQSICKPEHPFYAVPDVYNIPDICTIPDIYTIPNMYTISASSFCLLTSHHRNMIPPKVSHFTSEWWYKVFPYINLNLLLPLLLLATSFAFLGQSEQIESMFNTPNTWIQLSYCPLHLLMTLMLHDLATIFITLFECFQYGPYNIALFPMWPL